MHYSYFHSYIKYIIIKGVILLIYPANVSTASTGRLRVNLTSSVGFSPVENAEISISYTGTEGNVVEQLTTDSMGRSSTIELPAPPLELSLEPSAEQPYSEYTLSIKAEGFESAVITGVQILPTTDAIQQLSINAINGNANRNGITNGNGSVNRNGVATQQVTPAPGTRSIVIGPHTLFGDYPPKIPESEVKSVQETGEIVLSSVVIPEFVIVHDGPPTDASAANYRVRYKDYIKNVASSEIYATWPTATIQANILAIMSVALNRVFTEWYTGKGFNFTITSSTAFDQKFIYGRNTYANINKEVDEIFTSYLSRPNILQPIMTQYCDGVKTNCLSRGWMTQWGSKDLGDQGYTPINIIRNFYGSNMFINTAPSVAGIPSSFPNVTLRVGSTGENVRIIQRQLNAISDKYPLIPKLRVDGIFGPRTEAAVKTFQETFDLTPDGAVGKATWYSISNIYVAVTRLAELV
jgi:peptidoglycan hydrolase-like protein with peptidoglycan-binding domain